VADQLATPSDLAAILQTDVDTSTATLLLEIGTALVQEACGGMRIVQVVGDVLTIAGYSDSWLALPQIPVTAVTSVVLDGTTLVLANNDYKVIGDRLWRRTGWQANYGWPWNDVGIGSPWYKYAPPSLTWPYAEPSSVVVTYTHGYAAGAQELQLARGAVLGLIKSVYANPKGTTSERIDDYHVAYEAMAARMEASTAMKAALARKYGRRAGFGRLG
jgi:hypothetical protein